MLEKRAVGRPKEEKNKKEHYPDEILSAPKIQRSQEPSANDDSLSEQSDDEFEEDFYVDLSEVKV